MPRLVHEVPGDRFHAAVPAQKGHIVPVGNEADVLTVSLVGVIQSRLPGQRPEGRFFIGADGQQQVGQLTLGQLIEHIALILFGVLSPQQQPSAGGFVIVHPGVMAGCDEIGTVGQRPVQQGAELDLPVAVDAGIWRAAADVFGDKAVHDGGLEKIAQIQHGMGNTQACGDSSGGLNVIRRAAEAGTVLIGVEPQRNARHLIAQPLQQQGGAGAVYTAAHSDTHVLG